jgi:predicted dehydrogenase
MKVLILGYSDLVKRKIIPAIKKIKNTEYDIASKSRFNKSETHKNWYRNYDDAISQSDAKIVYISSINSLHYKYALKSLKCNKNVIVDKPITLNLNQTQNLIKLSKKKKLLLSEALVFNYHKQFNLIQKLILNNKISLDNIIMKFCIPKPKKNNFKLSKKMGGGCFNDMSPYAAAIKRYFIKSKITFLKIIMKNSKKINEGFCLIIKSQNTNFIGIFSHNSEYKNEINFLTNSYSLTASRFTAPPSEIDMTVNYTKKNIVKKYIVKKDDMFKNFLVEYLNKLRNKNITYYHNRIIKDAEFIDKMRKTR